MNALTLKNAGDVSIEITSDAREARDKALVTARLVASITDGGNQQSAVDALRRLKSITKSVEDSRKDVKAPVLEIGRQIDQCAAGFVVDVESEITRINKLLSAYTVAQLQKQAEAERQRQAEIARIESERRKSEESERARIADLERMKREQQAAAEAHFLAETEDEVKKANEAAESARKAAQAERERITLERERREQMARDAARLQAAVTRAPEKAQGQSVRKVPKFEVLDMSALYSTRPDLVRVEPNTAAINAVLSSGVREILGLRIWEEIVTQVR